MLCKTHIAGGITAAFIYKNLCNIPIDQMILLIPSGIIGSLIPDLDSKNSKLNQKLQVTKIFSLCKHRGIMHTPILYAILWLISLFLVQNSIARIVIYGLLLGVLSHLILDMLNPMGIRVFYPIGPRIRLAKIRTGSKGENIVFVMCIMVCIIAIFL